MARAAVPRMKTGGAIVMTGSVTGIDGQQGAARLFTDQGRHPRLHAFAGESPRRPRHPRQRRRARAGVDAAQSRRPARGEVAEFGKGTPMKRPAQPEEIAPAFVFLAAPSCSSYITGEILPIVGGY
jgi:NAD(P)-dependent dehydrogenase (short-subunit alcohol dehydrogenase family)